MKQPSNETWPPPPIRPQPVAEAGTGDEDWLTANDVVQEVTWRDYAIVYFAVFWLLLASLSLLIAAFQRELFRMFTTSSEPCCHKETFMRRLPTSLLASFALTAGTLLAALPASAQQAAPLMTPAVAMAPLVIPAPPGGKLRVEMDARSEDLLGMVKSFLKGIGETGSPTVLLPGQTAASAAAQNPIAQAIASGDLAAMLKDVNHVHVVVYEIPGAAGPASPVSVQVIPTHAALKKNVQITVITPAPAVPVPMSPVVPAFDSNSFYETAFASEGAHRILYAYADADAYKLVMVGFPNHQGFAFAASGGGYVVVERSDGYPDLEVLTAFISHVTTAVATSQMGKKMLNSTFDSSKLVLPEKMLFKK